MNILLDHFRENETDTTCFFTLTDGADTFNWHCDIQRTGMIEAEVQSELEARINEYRCGIYRKQYKEAVIEQTQEETEIQAWQRWVTNGCINSDETVIEKKWKNTW
jgi:hypothetical protein